MHSIIFQGRAGRFGVIGQGGQSGRWTAFDHTPGGIGTYSLVNSPIGGKAVKLDVASGNNAFLDSGVGVLAAPPSPGANLVVSISALTTGSLNLADVELNTYSTTNGTGAFSGYVLNVLGQPGNFATFTLTQPVASTVRSIRARIRARGTGSVTFDNLRTSIQN